MVWLFLADQPVAVSADDGSIVADRAMLEQRNPELRHLIPKDSDFYAYDLVITAADGRRVKVRAGDYKAEPYALPSEDYFRNVQFMATRWNGGYRTGDFLTRQATLGGRWLGLYTEKEALDAGDDGFGDSLKNPESILAEGERARRTFWTARIGRTKEFTEGSHDRLFDLTKLPEAPEFLQGGLLVRQGTRQPFILRDPEGFIVLHRTRLDEEGRLAFTRLDEGLRAKWIATLPLHELQNRFELSDSLLLYGNVQQTSKGVTNWQEHIVALDLQEGRLQSWNVPSARFLQRPSNSPRPTCRSSTRLNPKQSPEGLAGFKCH